MLVAGDAAPALDGLRAELDLAARGDRVLDDTGEATAFAPLHEGAARLDARPRVRDGPQPRRAGSTSVGVSDAWTRAGRPARRRAIPGVEVEHVPLPEALRRLAAGSTGVLAAEGVLGDAVAEAPRLGGRRRLVATG